MPTDSYYEMVRLHHAHVPSIRVMTFSFPHVPRSRVFDVMDTGSVHNELLNLRLKRKKKGKHEKNEQKLSTAMKNRELITF